MSTSDNSVQTRNFSHAKNSTFLLQFFLIFFLFFGLATTEGYTADNASDLFLAVRHLAEQGDPEAQFSLGMMYDQGGPLPLDRKKSAYWLTKSAQQHLPAACLYLGIKFEFGNGVKQDKKLAEKWYLEAALQDWAMAQSLLAQLYINSKDQPNDGLKAIGWLEQAAAKEYPGAQTQLDNIIPNLSARERIRLVQIRKTISDRLDAYKRNKLDAPVTD